MGNRKSYNNPFIATYTGIRDLFRKHEKVGTLSPGDRLDGKRVLITGASSGLGFATAVELARRGARVVMACRSGIPEKGEEAKRLSGSGDIDMEYVDLSDLQSIADLVQQIKKKHFPLDILICNAAVVPKKSSKTAQGLEQMFVVNYLAKYALVNRLIRMNLFNRENGAIPRIIFVSSESHRNPKDFNLNGFGTYQDFNIGKVMELYGYYKLMLTTFARELSRRLNNSGKTDYSVFAFCPGPVNTNIAREAPAIFQPLLKLIFSLFFKSPQKACEPAVYLAASPDMEGISWDYLFLMGRKMIDPKADDPENGRKLWDVSEEVCKKTTGGISIRG
ncbi:MAG: SDR family NAD(P)-dependent oxidoreductase [Bacteroidetes bacterium]|nr:SDR family NAD(P)-dependent oxidoreductase [Bacteroidota bacterium]